jgi:6-pyruvoyltetrahydropterin/6-carboxytetrahydropterin synthase
MGVYQSTKTYGHELGFSTAFRQWRAQSHCSRIHGYALAFKFTFEVTQLDHQQWAVDFGGLKTLKAILEDNFDHTLLVAEDDPEKELLLELDRKGIARVILVEHTGCERTAEYVYTIAEQWLKDAGFSPRVRLVSVEVMEHGANSALYLGEKT